MNKLNDIVSHTVQILYHEKSFLKDNTLAYLQERREQRQSCLFSSKSYEYYTKFNDMNVTVRIFRGGYHMGHSLVFKDCNHEEIFTILFKDDGDIKVTNKAILIADGEKLVNDTPIAQICEHIQYELVRKQQEVVEETEDIMDSVNPLLWRKKPSYKEQENHLGWKN